MEAATMETATAMMMKDSAIVDDDVQGFSLIDFSIADDSFLVPASDTINYDNAHSPESMELRGPARQDSFNLRKSLAWDSAFFTSAGVLDPDELSSMIEGSEVGRRQKLTLPRILEDISKSTDSVCSFESDSLTLESLEADLFCDVRASIQRSSKVSNSGTMGSSSMESTNISKARTADVAAGNMVKPKSGSKKIATGIPGLGKAIVPRAPGSQPGTGSRGSTSLIPRSRELAQKTSLIAETANKRIRVAADRAKLEIGDAGKTKGRGTVVPKIPLAGTSRGATLKSVTSLRASSSTLVIPKAGPPSLRFSCDSSTSSFGTQVSGPPKAHQRKIKRNASLPSGEKPKTPPLVSSKTKSTLGISRSFTSAKSTSKIPLGVSPVSSISEWSTESSASTSTVNQKTASLRASGTSFTGETLDISAVRHQDRDGKHMAGSPSQSAKQALNGTDISVQLISAKPSGLRLPSPKIGFFDVAKTGKSPIGGPQSSPSVPGNSNRSGTSGTAGRSPINGSSKGRPRNTAAKTTGAEGNSKLGTPKSGAPIKQSVPPVDESSATDKTPQAGNGETSSKASSGCKDELSEVGERISGNSSSENHINYKEVSDIRESVARSGLSSRKNGTPDSRTIKRNTVGKSPINNLDKSSKVRTPKSGLKIKATMKHPDESLSSGKSNESEARSELQNFEIVGHIKCSEVVDAVEFGVVSASSDTKTTSSAVLQEKAKFASNDKDGAAAMETYSGVVEKQVTYSSLDVAETNPVSNVANYEDCKRHKATTINRDVGNAVAEEAEVIPVVKEEANCSDQSATIKHDVGNGAAEIAKSLAELTVQEKTEQKSQAESEVSELRKVSSCAALISHVGITAADRTPFAVNNLVPRTVDGFNTITSVVEQASRQKEN